MRSAIIEELVGQTQSCLLNARELQPSIEIHLPKANTHSLKPLPAFSLAIKPGRLGTSATINPSSPGYKSTRRVMFEILTYKSMFGERHRRIAKPFSVRFEIQPQITPITQV